MAPIAIQLLLWLDHWPWHGRRTRVFIKRDLSEMIQEEVCLTHRIPQSLQSRLQTDLCPIAYADREEGWRTMRRTKRVVPRSAVGFREGGCGIIDGYILTREGDLGGQLR